MTAIFDTESSLPFKLGLGGNGTFVWVSPAQEPFNFTATGRSEGGCGNEGPSTTPYFYINANQTVPSRLIRKFTPSVMNWLANPANVDKVLAEPDYSSFTFELEGLPVFTQATIRGSGHFGVGSVLGMIGDAYSSRGGPLFISIMGIWIACFGSGGRSICRPDCIRSVDCSCHLIMVGRICL